MTRYEVELTDEQAQAWESNWAVLSRLGDSSPFYQAGHIIGDAIRANPPKPAEPTEFGAMVKDRSGVTWLRWVNKSHHPWISGDTGEISAYADLDVVEVLR